MPGHQEGPYRETCTECVDLRSRLNEALGLELHPYQGIHLVDHRCVFCGQSLFMRRSGGEDNDLFSPGCTVAATGYKIMNKHDMTMCHGPTMSERDVGIFFKKIVQSTVNASCPKTPHLHRQCLSCGGKWNERTASQQKLVTT